MNAYELTYIITPDLTLEGAQAKAKELETAIQNHQGVIVQQTNPVAKTLSYPIKGKASGFFGVIEFQLEPEAVKELETITARDSQIIRSIVLAKWPVKVKKEKRTRPAKPSIISSILGVIKPEAKKEESAKEMEKKEETKPAVELKDIEEQLEKILAE